MFIIIECGTWQWCGFASYELFTTLLFECHLVCALHAYWHSGMNLTIQWIWNGICVRCCETKMAHSVQYLVPFDAIGFNLHIVNSTRLTSRFHHQLEYSSIFIFRIKCCPDREEVLWNALIDFGCNLVAGIIHKLIKIRISTSKEDSLVFPTTFSTLVNWREFCNENKRENNVINFAIRMVLPPNRGQFSLIQQKHGSFRFFSAAPVIFPFPNDEILVQSVNTRRVHVGVSDWRARKKKLRKNFNENANKIDTLSNRLRMNQSTKSSNSNMRCDKIRADLIALFLTYSKKLSKYFRKSF